MFGKDVPAAPTVKPITAELIFIRHPAVSADDASKKLQTASQSADKMIVIIYRFGRFRGEGRVPQRGRSIGKVHTQHSHW